MKLDLDLQRIEEVALANDTQIHQWAAKLVMRVRQLEHELADPNYLYVGRISRQAIICRNAEISKLQEELKQKNLLIEQFKDELKNVRAELEAAKKQSVFPRDLHDRS